MARATLGSIKSNKVQYTGGYSANSAKNPYTVKIDGKDHNIGWLI